jgi:small GTP-binding protein
MNMPAITPPLPDLDLCFVEGGDFMMGDDNGEYDDEKSAHRVLVSGFWMGKYPVTQRLWQSVMGNNPSKFKGARRPVEQVSWYDAQNFLQKLNALPEIQAFIRQLDPLGTEFRLPTEAEWEYAARGGKYSQGYQYAGSDRANQVAWHRENSGEETHEVGLLLPNELSLHDMTGNVWEWSEDWCSELCRIYGDGGRFWRGGSWDNAQQRCRAINRDSSIGNYITASLGFRLVISFSEACRVGYLPSTTTTKPKFVCQIERFLNITLHPAPPFPTPLDGLMAFKENCPKYLLDEQGHLTGLNLAATGLNDEQWQKVASILEENAVSLNALNLCANQLKNLPLPGISALAILDIEDNPLLNNIPPDVLKLGNAAILKWLKDTGKRPVLEAKVMFIGDSNYGKTHLISMLKDGSVAPGITTTHGIERSRIRDAESPAGNIRLNVWDLGGQQFMRSTHQLFFTERTLYVLVTEARRERRELNHWLKLVHELAADAPVLVVINKIDLDDHDLDREPLRREYPNIKGFVRTACFDSKSGGPVQGIIALDTIKELEQEIHRIVSDRRLMPSVFAEQRQEWFTVKDELEQMQEDYISYEDYQRRPHIKDLPAEEQKQNLKQLAWLGAVVSFIDDHRLNDTHVINPQWLLDGIYRFINDAEIKDGRKGEFSFADFQRLLDVKRYPEQKYNFFVELMKKFRLCYPLRCRDNAWLLPDLFADIEPKNVWPETGAMRFRLNYSSFPPDLFITQFIVECYQDIVDEKRWRSGVVIQDKIGDCPAIVRRSFRHDRIDIEVAGPKTMRRSSLHHLLNVFASLHQPYEPSLKVAREIPYKSKDKEIWLNYDHLLKLEQHRKPYFHPELEENIPVSEVLDGYGRPGRQDEQLARIEGKIDAHIIETRTDHLRAENKLNKLRHELERFQIEFKRANAIDERKLKAHFEELKTLAVQLAQLPEIKKNTQLTQQLAVIAEEFSGMSIKLTASLLPKIIEQLLPINIEFECDLGNIIEKLLAVFKKIVS